MKAIIVVDMQNDFSEIGAIPINGMIDLANRINNFIKKITRDEFKIIATQDWHHFKHMSFIEFPSHCVYWTKGAKLLDPLDVFQFDLKVKKGTKRKIENFSGFYNGKNKTKLLKFLNQFNIKEVYVVGVAAELCVKNTIMDLIKFGFQPILIEDLTLSLEKNYVLELDGLKKINSNQI